MITKLTTEMKFGWIGTAILILIFLGCSRSQYPASWNENTKKIKIYDDLFFNAHVQGDKKELFLTKGEQKHGFSFTYNLQNQIQHKDIFFHDTLLQLKEYYWKADTIESIVYSTFEYTKSKKKTKNIYYKYPKDNIDFTVKYNAFESKFPSYKVELNSEGYYIASFHNLDSIVDNSYIESNFDNALKASRYLQLEKPNIKNGDVFYNKQFMFFSYDGLFYSVDYQVVIYNVPIFIKNDKLYEKVKDIVILY